MSAASFATELAAYGPHAAAARPSLAAAQAYCRRLAQTHYENFTVVSWLLPRALRPHFHSIYAYCRWADDLADETGDPGQSLELLDWWEAQLHACYRGLATHPVFVALADTIRQFEIPTAPFVDLLTAFRRDQRQARYATFEALLDYCRCSANPVGRLVLYLGRCHTPRNVELSDSICTGLQLVNFWQDVARDRAIGRVYVPEDACRRHGVDEAMLAAGVCTPQLQLLLAEQVAIAEEMLHSGRPLVDLVPQTLRIDVALFIAGGLEIAAAIRRQDFDVWAQRPTVSKWTRLRLLARAWWQTRGRRKAQA